MGGGTGENADGEGGGFGIWVVFVAERGGGDGVAACGCVCLGWHVRGGFWFLLWAAKNTSCRGSLYDGRNNYQSFMVW